MEIVKSYPNNLDKLEIYRMTRSHDIIKMSTIKDSVLDVAAYIYYHDIRTKSNGSEEEYRILTVKTEQGEIYATNSKTFIDEFLYISDLFPDDLKGIKVVGAISKNARNFITCEKV